MARKNTYVAVEKSASGNEEDKLSSAPLLKSRKSSTRNLTEIDSGGGGGGQRLSRSLSIKNQNINTAGNFNADENPVKDAPRTRETMVRQASVKNVVPAASGDRDGEDKRTRKTMVGNTGDGDVKRTAKSRKSTIVDKDVSRGGGRGSERATRVDVSEIEGENGKGGKSRKSTIVPRGSDSAVNSAPSRKTKIILEPIKK